MAQAKRVIDDVDPDAWGQLVRVELERRLGAMKPVEGETVQNIPGQLYRAMFGNDKQTKVLFSGLEGDQAKNLKFLQTALGRARLGRPGGSHLRFRFRGRPRSISRRLQRLQPVPAFRSD